MLPVNLNPTSLRRVAERYLQAGTPPTTLSSLSIYREVVEDPSATWDSPDDQMHFQALVELTVAHVEKGMSGANKRGKPARTVPAVKWKVSIRHDLALYIDMLLADPVRGGLGYGERSALVERLVLDWARKNGFKG